MKKIKYTKETNGQRVWDEKQVSKSKLSSDEIMYEVLTQLGFVNDDIATYTLNTKFGDLTLRENHGGGWILHLRNSCVIMHTRSELLQSIRSIWERETKNPGPGKPFDEDAFFNNL